MELLKFLDIDRRFIFKIFLLGVINSLLTAGLIYLINTVVAGGEVPYLEDKGTAGLVYLALVVLSFFIKRFLQQDLIRVNFERVYRFTTDAINKLRLSEVEVFEKLGKEKVYTALGDARTLSYVPAHFIEVFQSLVIVLCGVVYLTYISWLGGLIVILVIAGLAAFYQFRDKVLYRNIKRLRKLQDEFYAYIQDLLSGFKELKIHRTSSERLFHEYLIENQAKHKTLNTQVENQYLDNQLLVNNSWYLVIGSHRNNIVCATFGFSD